ncbi:MAG: sigma-70 family RNA polymerase sigma factor [Aliiglaciecola sp.]|uniref:RNA polymerase sigma factor n=1 Tax=Aliiglaciecola sp. TaxID=1872441 RepID=UPI003299D40C
MENSIAQPMPLAQEVLLAQKGDMQAYERLIKQYQNLVTSIALAIVKDIDDSEEIAQQVFVSLWQNLNQLKNPNSFLPWIRQSTRFTAYNFLRDNKVKEKVDSAQANLILEQLVDPKEENEEQLYLNNQKQVLRQFIDELASDEREIVLLYYREEQSSKQVASLLNLSEANVRKKLSRVRQTLKTKLLKNASAYIYSSAPALGFSGLILSMLVPSAPAAAATLTTTVGSTSKAGSSFFMKLFMIIGGSLLGAFLAVFSIIWSSNIAIKRLETLPQKAVFKRYRNETIAWVIAWGFIITAGYEFTSGWMGPVFTYLGFSVGLVLLVIRSMRLMHTHATNASGKKANKATMVINYSCLLLGVVIGFSGLVIGLINNGRLVI